MKLIELKPWRTDGKHILVAANRSFGMRGFIMPERWGENTAEALRRITNRPVRLRLHPGNGRAPVPLEDDLRDACAVVIWSSSVGVKALIEGIPVICCAPWWICRGATHGMECDLEALHVDECADDDRANALHALAWAQWSVDEIKSGFAFEHLLHHDVERIAVSRG